MGNLPCSSFVPKQQAQYQVYQEKGYSSAEVGADGRQHAERAREVVLQKNAQVRTEIEELAPLDYGTE
jgi:hypothetical protein